MGARTVHKTDVERALMSARAKVTFALDNEHVPPEVKSDLEDVERLIRSAELGLGARRLTQPMAQMLEQTHIQDRSELDRWLLQNFTHQTTSEGDSTGFKQEDADTIEILSPKGTHGHYTSTELQCKLQQLSNSPEGAAVMENLGKLSFDVLAFSALPEVAGRPLACLGAYTLQREGLADMAKSDPRITAAENADLFEERLHSYLEEVESHYLENPYHNKEHGADVMMTMQWLCKTLYFRESFSPIDHLACVLAAAVHDVGHPGKTNDFQIATGSELALRYNDKSVLESMHSALAFEVMKRRKSCDWFDLVHSEYRRADGQVVNTKKYIRKCMVTMVLATDMTQHNDHVTELKNFTNERDEGVKSQGAAAGQPKDQKLQIMSCLLHAADISNPTKSRSVAMKWTLRVLDEFWAQGDVERDAGLAVSPLCDRNGADIPAGQLGFIGYVINPFWIPLAQLIPECQEAIKNVQDNQAFWSEQKEAKATFEDISRLCNV